MRVQINKLGREYNDNTELFASLGNTFERSHCKYVDQKKPISHIFFFCDHCGSEIFGEWKANRPILHSGSTAGICFTCRGKQDCAKIEEKLDNEYREYCKSFENEIQEVAKLTHCPVCGASLSRKAGLFFVDYSHRRTVDFPEECDISIIAKKSHDLEDILSEMKEYRDKIDEKMADKVLKNYVSLCDLPVRNTIDSSALESVRATSSKLKEYIGNLIELEISIYSLSKRMNTLYLQRITANRNAVASKYVSKIEGNDRIALLETRYSECVAKLSEYRSGKIGIALPIKPEPPVLATANLFNKKRVTAENEALQAKYQSDLTNYEKQLQDYEAKKSYLIVMATDEVEQAKKDIELAKAELDQLAKKDDVVTPATYAKSMIDKEIEEAETLLKKLYECRNGLYSYDIVFKKYRNAVALSTFYEYLEAGRCTTLDGADGAYNLYENQVRADMIIGQLSQVIEKLDQIKDTQYMIYSELQTVNRSLDHLNETMDTALVSIQNMEKDVANISTNTDVIAHNSAVTAYYSKLNAELTNSLGYMVAFK